jgi:hypothetical protein
MKTNKDISFASVQKNEINDPGDCTTTYDMDMQSLQAFYNGELAGRG